MPRGSNSQAEYDRVMSREEMPERASKSGTGPKSHEKRGYGRDSMQKNSDKSRKTSMS